MLVVVFGVLNMVVGYERWDMSSREFMDSGCLSVVLFVIGSSLFFYPSATDPTQVD